MATDERRAARRTDPPTGARRHVALVTYDGGNSIDVTGPLEVFATAGRHPRFEDGGARPYSVEVVSGAAGPVTMHSGLRLVAERAFDDLTGGVDTLVVCGGECREAMRDERLLTWLVDMNDKVRRMSSVCSGSFILAAAGLLDGRRATTHWAWCGAMARAYPAVRVEADSLFVRDGKLHTSAGVTAGMDLALAMVEDDLGRDVALWVARQMVLFLKRPGGQSQFSSHLAAQSVASDTLGDLTEWIVEHTGEDLSVEALASRVAMSPRNFARVFTRETGMTPAKFVEQARVDGARRALEESSLPLETVARECGFGNAERMRRTFMRHLRVAPQEYRRRFVPA